VLDWEAAVSLFQISLIGLLATTVMTAFLYFIHWAGFANGDMVRAIGSAITKRYDGSFWTGMAVHYVSGIVFAGIYVYILSLVPPLADDQAIKMAGLGALLGFVHGLVVSLGLVVVVAEHHPMEQFRRAGFGVALVHLAAHVVYGGVVGWCVGVI
jgi:hypothetical protein